MSGAKVTGTRRFRVGVSADFTLPDGRAAFPSYDLGPLEADPRFEIATLPKAEWNRQVSLEGFDAVVFLGERATADSFPGDGRLVAIVRMGVGYDSLDMAACTANDVAVTIAPPGVRRPMAVAIVTLLLALAGNLMQKDRICRGGGPAWPDRLHWHGVGLEGRTLASIGLGNIGRELFRMAAPYGLTFIAHDPYVDPAAARELGVELVGLEEAFARADFLSFNCPLTAETRHLGDAERFALMKQSAYVINTSRGPVVDQQALYDALVAGRIAGAGLDVFDPEPPAPDDPILTLDNVILTPHSLGFTDHMFARFGEINRAAIQAIARGRAPENVVNTEVLERPGFRAKLASWAAG